jgi:hypothetical protein
MVKRGAKVERREVNSSQEYEVKYIAKRTWCKCSTD